MKTARRKQQEPKREERCAASCDDIHQPVGNHNDLARVRAGELALDVVRSERERFDLGTIHAARRAQGVAKLAIDLNCERDPIVHQKRGIEARPSRVGDKPAARPEPPNTPLARCGAAARRAGPERESLRCRVADGLAFSIAVVSS